MFGTIRQNYIVKDRVEAGSRLAERLLRFKRVPNQAPDTLILALPRGGVPVAFEIARKLDQPLDLMVVRKLGLPFHKEVAMGALASGDVIVWNEAMMDSLVISKKDMQDVIDLETAELHRRQKAYRGDKPFPELDGKNVILVDDGIATGATMKSAIGAVKKSHPKSLTVAVPVAPPHALQEISKSVDHVEVLAKPSPFHAVGLWYSEFPQTEDKEVIEILRKSATFGESQQ